MKFKGTGLVWDKAKNRSLVRFQNGEADVQDKATQDALQALGYEGEGEPAGYNSMNVTELRKAAKEQEIEGYSNMNKDELLEALGGEDDE